MSKKPVSPLIGLKKKNYKKAVRDFVDEDYSQTLGIEDKLWLADFQSRYYDRKTDAESFCEACCVSKPWGKERRACQDPVCVGRKDNYKRSNSAESETSTYNFQLEMDEADREASGGTDPEAAIIESPDAQRECGDWNPLRRIPPLRRK